MTARVQGSDSGPDILGPLLRELGTKHKPLKWTSLVRILSRGSRETTILSRFILDRMMQMHH